MGVESSILETGSRLQAQGRRKKQSLVKSYLKTWFAVSLMFLETQDWGFFILIPSTARICRAQSKNTNLDASLQPPPSLPCPGSILHLQEPCTLASATPQV